MRMLKPNTAPNNNDFHLFSKLVTNRRYMQKHTAAANGKSNSYILEIPNIAGYRERISIANNPAFLLYVTLPIL